VNLENKIAVIFGGNGDISSNLIQKFFLHNIDKIFTTYYKKQDKIEKLKKLTVLDYFVTN